MLGLFGRYASGKTTVAKIFAESGYEIIEVDHLGHQALIDKKREIINVFGKNILAADGSIDRKQLGEIVFNSDKALSRLESIVHPAMCDRVRQLIAESNSKRILISAAILHKMKLDTLCDKVIQVTAPTEMLIEWGMKRDKLSREEMENRLKNQLAINIDENNADHILENRGNPDELKSLGIKLITKLEQEFIQ